MDKFPYGALSDGREVTAYRIRNANGCELVVLDYGVTLVSLTMPDRDGKPVDVILGYDTAKEYEENGGFFGACIGRVCNRIGGSSFTLDGVKYDLVPSEGKNQLHGGTQGFDRRFFDVEEVENGLVFTRLSPDGEEGFPGNVQVAITVTNGRSLQLISIGVLFCCVPLIILYCFTQRTFVESLVMTGSKE